MAQNHKLSPLLFTDNNNNIFQPCTCEATIRTTALHTHQLHVDFERTSRLTLRAGAWFDFLVCRLIEGTQNERAFGTIVLHHAELRQNSRAARHDPTGTN